MDSNELRNLKPGLRLLRPDEVDYDTLIKILLKQLCLWVNPEHIKASRENTEEKTVIEYTGDEEAHLVLFINKQIRFSIFSNRLEVLRVKSIILDDEQIVFKSGDSQLCLSQDMLREIELGALTGEL